MSRDINKLHPQAKELALKLVDECAAQGLIIKITDCLRDKKEQDALYAQGRTTSGSIVTNVQYPNSMHNWGIAFDFCRNDGTGAYNESGRFFEKVGEIGKKLGLEWGGDWKSIVDKPHFQLSYYGSTPSKLKTLYGTPEKFRSVWSKNVVSGTTSVSADEGVIMPTIRRGSRGKAVRIWQIIIGVECDGIFGVNTDRVTREFQKSSGVSVDGIVGKNTWKAGLESV